LHKNHFALNSKAYDKYPAHSALEEERRELDSVHIREMFRNDPERAEKMTIEDEGLLFDFSKNRITDKTVELFGRLATESGLADAREEYFSGGKINKTENRAVLHTALRNFRIDQQILDGEDIQHDIREVRSRMKTFSDSVIGGEWKGATGKAIKSIINIGIGGSDLGPVMVVESLAAQRNHLEIHFVSNVDGWHLHSVLGKCDPETTLVVVVSKTFTTQETMANAMNAKTWLTNALGEVTANHFVAVSTNIQRATDFGIEEKNIFGFWDWVGGRYSLWSSVGLTISLACGYGNFEELLKGAESSDVHFAESSWEKNIPFLMAALGLWYNNYWDYSSHAILPYDQRLHRFPAYLQQADMESNGKSVDRNGERVSHNTGPIIWGECGTNGQHAFYQLIHQGTRIIPCDFILFAKPDHAFLDQHEKLVANCIAQSRALVMGRSREEIPKNSNAAFDVRPFKVFEGNRPSNTMIFDRLTPYNLGKLISYYEHKIFVQGFFWNVFSYDQWGVELGKILATNILERSENESHPSPLDSSSEQLLKFVSVKS